MKTSPTPATPLIAYYRVSTKKQGASGLGLDAQRTAVEDYARSIGGAIIKEFTEIESGGKGTEDRPELAAAIPFAKRAGAVLVVAKLDRLARSVFLLSKLMHGGIDFIACDCPAANRFTVHILAAVAEYERELISKRTKAAMAEAKRRGGVFGSSRPGHWKGREKARLGGLAKARERSAVTIHQKAVSEYADLRPAVLKMRGEGFSLKRIADELNAGGHQTRRGASFTAVQVSGILNRG